MGRFIFFSFNILLFSLLISCKPGEKEQDSKVSEIHEQVMHFHDEAMAKLPALKKLGTKLYDTQSLTAYQNWPDEVKNNLGQILNQLGDAEKSMWNWMYAYVEPSEDQTDDQKIEYLTSELDKVKVVHKKIFESMEAAEKFGEKHQIQYVK